MSLCEDFIRENLNEANCYKMYRQAQLLQSKKIVNLALQYMAKNLYNFARSEMFKKIEFKGFIKMLQFQQPTVCVDFKIETIVDWCCQKDSTASAGSEDSNTWDNCYR
ncbi:Kelch repeat and BTB domain-containing protein A55 [Biomphalaria glabrata]|nr:kelch-like protein 40b [Biomphalaria glabrata]